MLKMIDYSHSTLYDNVHKEFSHSCDQTHLKKLQTGEFDQSWGETLQDGGAELMNPVLAELESDSYSQADEM